MSWYKTGTVNVTNASATVEGTGTYWLLNATAGDLFTIDNSKFYEILSVTDNDTLVLASNYAESTDTGVTYAIIRNFTSTTNAQLALKLTNLVNSWQLRQDELVDWQAGTADGGPNNDGQYPLTDVLGNTNLVDCPAKIASMAGTGGDVLTALLSVDGTGSGLDADKLDGYQASEFLLASGYSAADVLTKVKTVDGTGSGLDADFLDGREASEFVLATDYENLDVLSKVKAVDGADSGLDADLLDGRQLTEIAPALGSTYSNNLNTAVAAIGSTPTTLAFFSDMTVTSNLSIPSTLELLPMNGAKINHTTYTIAYAGPVERWPARQVFNGTGAVSGPTVYRPEWFGTDATAFAKALASNGDTAATVVTQRGKEYDITGGVSWTSKNKTLTGGGIISNGALTIGAGSGSPVELHFKIDAMEFTYDARSDSEYSVVLQRARSGEILNSTFTLSDHAIHIAQVDAIQHVNRLRISGCKFGKLGTRGDDRVNYALYSDGYNSGFTNVPFTVGDIDFTGNHFIYARIRHLYLRGQDGFTSGGNTCYFDGSVAYPDPDKLQNYYLEYATNLNIYDNNLFAPGLQGIYLSHCRDYIIKGNLIIAPGQVNLSDGIFVTNGGISGSNATGVISGNYINYPSKSGISIGANTNRINVGGNSVTYAGTAGCYYGDVEYGNGTLASISHYGVDVHSTSQVMVLGNMMPDNTVNMSTANTNGWFGYNFDSTKDLAKKPMVSVVSTADTTIAATGYDTIYLNQSAPATVTEITGWVVGKEIDLIGLNGNTTIHNSAVYLKNSTTVNIPTNGILRLKGYASPNVWREVSRSF